MSNSGRLRPKQKCVIGWREWVALPGLGVAGIKAKVDTGARTSALHAYRITPFERDDESWVSFYLHPVQHRRKPEVHCECVLHDLRSVRSSNGSLEPRYVISTMAVVSGVEREIEITLTNRDEMGFRMLLGREALRGQFLVDPRRSYTGGKPAEAAGISGRRRIERNQE